MHSLWTSAMAGASERMQAPHSSGLILAYSLALVLVLLGGSAGRAQAHEQQLEVVSREQKDSGDSSLSATIDYLEKLDKYYSQIARPRFGRSGGGSSAGFGQLLAARAPEPRHLDRGELRLLELLVGQLGAHRNRDLLN